MKRLLVTLLSVFILMGCTTTTTEPSLTPDSTEDIGACVFGEDCTTSEETPASELMDWEIISFKDSLDYTDGTAILFYSFDDCPYCKEAIPVLDEVLENEDIKIYYVHTERDEREAGNSTYDEVYAYFKDTIEAAGYDSIYMPSIFFIKDGEVVAYHVGTVDGHDPSVSTMTDEQVAELRSIFEDDIALMK